MFLLLLVFVCQGVLGGQMMLFCVFGCVMVGWYELFRGKCWLFGAFLGFWLAVWQFETRDVVSLAMGWWASLVYEMRLRFYKV